MGNKEQICTRAVAVSVPGYWRDKMGEVLSLIGPACIGERDHSPTEVGPRYDLTHFVSLIRGRSSSMVLPSGQNAPPRISL